MGLITKEVEVMITGINGEYYENLGYNLEKHYDRHKKGLSYKKQIINVKVEDLQNGSHVKVDVECDKCGEIHCTIYKNYIKRKKDNGKVYCKKCGKQVYCGGENNYNWNKNKTYEEREIERNYPEYRELVKRVMVRDNYTCMHCGKKHCDLFVHHLDGYNWCKEKRLDDTNCITLCKNCHCNFHIKYGHGNNTKEQYLEWAELTSIELEKYNGELPKSKQIYCIEENRIYESINDFAEKKNISVSMVYKVCKKEMKNIKLKEHFLFYDDYLNMSKEEVDNYIKWDDDKSNKRRKKVVCLNTKDVFESISDAKRKFILKGDGISDCCKGNLKTSGIHPVTKEKLVWRYYEDYLNMTDDDIKQSFNYKYNYRCVFGKGDKCPNSKKVYCITTGEIFVSVTEAKETYNACKISECCNGKRNYSGKLEDGTLLKWMYYDEYSKLINNEYMGNYTY